MAEELEYERKLYAKRPSKAQTITALVEEGLIFRTVVGSNELTIDNAAKGYRICSGPGGYRSTEWRWRDMTFGQDSDGSRWTTSRWRRGRTNDGQHHGHPKPPACKALEVR